MTTLSRAPSAARVALNALPDIPLVQPGDDLVHIILDGLQAARIELATGDILVIAHKIVSKAEGRLVRLETVEPGERALELAALTGKDPRFLQVVLDGSIGVERARQGLIVTEQRSGWVVANSAVDQSNVN